MGFTARKEKVSHLSVFAFLKERESRIKWEKRLGFLFQTFGSLSFISTLIFSLIHFISDQSVNEIFFLSLFAGLFLGGLFFYIGWKMRSIFYCRFCLSSIGPKVLKCPNCSEDLTSTKVEYYR